MCISIGFQGPIQASNGVLVIVTAQGETEQLPARLHLQIEFNRPAAHRAVLDIGLVPRRTVHAGIKGFSAIGTLNPYILQHGSFPPGETAPPGH